MNIFSAIIDSIANFIKQNPLTFTILVMLAVFAPSLFGSILIGLLIFGVIIMAVPLFMFFKLWRMSRKVEKDSQSQNFGRGYYSRQTYTNTNRQQRKDEGEVKVYSTGQQQEKRVSEDVGDYVDFEEVKK
ncbi:MAG: DUF4834 family protein [Alistipes sp.]|nr:DUF4834 family protein [Alistipes sp.]